jgi:predicted signal transduction protein with EAL and GGDEF domain
LVFLDLRVPPRPTDLKLGPLVLKHDSNDFSPSTLETGSTSALPLRLQLRFTDPAQEQRFIKYYVAFYFRYVQASMLLGISLIVGDYLVDRIVYPEVAGNLWRLTAALPVLLIGLAYTLLPNARRHWQPVISVLVVAEACGLFLALVRMDADGGAGLRSWVSVLYFAFLEFYCFVILGVQFRYALASGMVILGIFTYALWNHAGMTPGEASYWVYHTATLSLLAAGVGWWREYLLRKEFVARVSLDDSRAEAEMRAMRLAHYDEVTGLPNRRLFAELAESALARFRRGGMGGGLLHVEIDRLASVHDAYGRGQGDMVLAEITQRMRAGIRGDEHAAAGPANPPGVLAGEEAVVLARLGDSAFVILLADMDEQERASPVAQRLLAAVTQPIVVDGQPLVLSASIGIAMFPGDAPDLAGLMRCAEQAARAAGDAGGAQHKFFDEALNARARERVVLETELRQAIQTGNLCLYYQPKVDVRSRRLVGAEALVRWQHPQRGLIPPGMFIPLAEESGLIAPLTDWVLNAACASLRRWSDAGLLSLPLSVNLPASSLVDPRFPEQLDALMSQYGLHPSQLTLELTETMLMQDVTSAIQVLDRLRERGFGLALDDFGTGYSSLNYLKRLPMSELKIDRAFVIDVARGGRDGALAAAVITLGNELGLQVVAEGVETEEQAEFLRVRGCVLHQGYLYARPVPSAEFERMLQAGSV